MFHLVVRLAAFYNSFIFMVAAKQRKSCGCWGAAPSTISRIVMICLIVTIAFVGNMFLFREAGIDLRAPALSHAVSLQRRRLSVPPAPVWTEKNVILVTGAAGFIGFHLSSQLASQFPGQVEIIGLDNFDHATSRPLKLARSTVLLKEHGITVIPGDVCDAGLLARLFTAYNISQVVHLAASAGVRRSILYPQEYIRNNVECFTTLLGVLKEHPGVRLVYASSSSVYGRNEAGLPLKENAPLPDPINVYALTKVQNEMLANVHREMYGLEAVGLRFFTVYGPWGRPDMAAYLFSINITHGLAINTPENAYRDFTHVNDIVSGIIKVLHTRVSAPVLNIGGGQAHPLDDFVHTLGKELGKDVKQVYKRESAAEARATLADLSISREEIGYEPIVSLNAGIASFASWFKALPAPYHNQQLFLDAPTMAGAPWLTAMVALSKVFDPVLMAVVTPGVLDQAHSWLCNTADMGDIHSRTVIFVTDAASVLEVRSWGFIVHVFEIPAPPQVAADQGKEIAFGDGSYPHLMLMRQRTILQLLKHGVNLLMFDIDMIWFRNPLEDTRMTRSTTDMVVTYTKKKYYQFCGCFLYVRARPPTIKMWERVSARYAAILAKSAEFQAEQPLLADAAAVTKNKDNLTMYWLPVPDYVSGLYFRPEEKELVSSVSRPFVVHNNWLRGTRWLSKLDRASAFGIWFLNPDGTCNVPQVAAAVSHGKPIFDSDAFPVPDATNPVHS